MTDTTPLTAPVLVLGLDTAGVQASGVPAPTGTVTTWVTVSTPLVALTVKVSVLDPVAA